MSFPICCPKCKRVAYEQTSGVVSYYDPHFKCRYCDWTGPLYLKNHDPYPEPQTLLDLFLLENRKKHLQIR